MKARCSEMYKTWLILRHYFKRATLDGVGLLFLILLPLGILVLNVHIFGYNTEPVMIGGYDVVATQVSMVVMVMFQFFGGMYIGEWIYDDFRGDQRWRLFSAPVTQNRIIFAAAIASWLFTVVQGALIIAVTALFFDAYWGNFLFWIPTLFLLSAISQFMHITISLFARKKKTAQTIGFITVFSMAYMGGVFIEHGARIQEVLVRIPTPLSAGIRAIRLSGITGDNTRLALESMLILLAMLTALIVVSAIAGRLRKA